MTVKEKMQAGQPVRVSMVKGNSMIDVGLLPGDKVAVDRFKTPDIGDIVLAEVDQFTIGILDYTAQTKCYG